MKTPARVRASPYHVSAYCRGLLANVGGGGGGERPAARGRRAFQFDQERRDRPIRSGRLAKHRRHLGEVAREPDVAGAVGRGGEWIARIGIPYATDQVDRALDLASQPGSRLLEDRRHEAPHDKHGAHGRDERRDDLKAGALPQRDKHMHLPCVQETPAEANARELQARPVIRPRERCRERDGLVMGAGLDATDEVFLPGQPAELPCAECGEDGKRDRSRQGGRPQARSAGGRGRAQRSRPSSALWANCSAIIAPFRGRTIPRLSTVIKGNHSTR